MRQLMLLVLRLLPCLLLNMLTLAHKCCWPCRQPLLSRTALFRARAQPPWRDNEYQLAAT